VSRYEERLADSFERAISNKTSKGKTLLGRANYEVAEKINDLIGIDVLNRTHILTDYDIRHIIKRHGNSIAEFQRKQIVIEKRDVLNIIDIINNPDKIIRGNINRTEETIRYIKSYEDNTVFVVELVPKNNNYLKIKTMWKKPSALTNDKVPSSTSKTKGSVISSTSDSTISKKKIAVNNSNIQKKRK